MKAQLIALLLLSCFMNSCCSHEQRVEPPYPSEVSGWSSYERQGVRIVGTFVLRKNETIDNGRLKIKVLELIPRDPCAEGGAFNDQARVTFEFVRLSDQR